MLQSAFKIRDLDLAFQLMYPLFDFGAQGGGDEDRLSDLEYFLVVVRLLSTLSWSSDSIFL